MPITERTIKEYVCDRCGKIITAQQVFLPLTRGVGTLHSRVEIVLTIEYSNARAVICNGCARDILRDEIARLGTLDIPSESST